MPKPTGPPTIEAPTGPPKPSERKPTTQSRSDYKVTSGPARKAHKVVIYGPGGIGKTTLANLVGKNPLTIDLERGSLDLDCERIDGIDDFNGLRAVLGDDSIWRDRGAVIVDSASRAEEMASAWVVASIPHEKQGVCIRSIEDYGWGKGLGHVYDAMLLLLGDLDRHILAGRHVVVISHDCTANVPNPAGEDWIRYEPRLQSPGSGKNSVRLRIREWTDHLLFLGYDVAVSKEGRATGAGTRMIYPKELPIHMAKSRTLGKPIPFASAVDASLWNELLGEESKCPT